MNSLELMQAPADRLPGDAVGVFYFEDQRPLAGPCALLDWRLDGLPTRFLLKGKLTGKAGEHAVYQNNGRLAAAWAFFVGGGRWQELDKTAYALLVRHLLGVVSEAGFKEPSLCLPVIEGLDTEDITELVRREMDGLQKKFTICRLSTNHDPAV